MDKKKGMNWGVMGLGLLFCLPCSRLHGMQSSQSKEGAFEQAVSAYEANLQDKATPERLRRLIAQGFTGLSDEALTTYLDKIIWRASTDEETFRCFMHQIEQERDSFRFAASTLRLATIYLPIELFTFVVARYAGPPPLDKLVDERTGGCLLHLAAGSAIDGQEKYSFLLDKEDLNWGELLGKKDQEGKTIQERLEQGKELHNMLHNIEKRKKNLESINKSLRKQSFWLAVRNTLIVCFGLLVFSLLLGWGCKQLLLIATQEQDDDEQDEEKA